MLGDAAREIGGALSAGADGGSALREFHQLRQRRLDPADAVLDLLRIAGELLAEGQGGGVLRVRAADLDDVRPGLRPWRLRASASWARAGRSRWTISSGAGDMHRGRVGVVGRLAEIDVVVGVDRLLGADLAAEHLDRAVGDHLVDVHVGLGARAGLPDDEREMIVELAVDHLVGGGDDRIGQLGGQAAKIAIDFGGGALDDAEGADDGGGWRSLSRCGNCRASARPGRPNSGRRELRLRRDCRFRCAFGWKRWARFHRRPVPQRCRRPVNSSCGRRRG